MDRSSFDWSEPDANGEFQMMSVSGPSEDEERASYGTIEVKRCIYCETDAFEVAFVFMQPRAFGSQCQDASAYALYAID
jgi:hypothetical protein